MDEATIRVLRDIAGAVVTGMQAVGAEVQADGAEDPPARVYPADAFKPTLHVKEPKPPLGIVLDVVATVCAHIRDALDEHLPEHAERQKRMLAERAAREAAEDAAERAKAAK